MGLRRPTLDDVFLQLTGQAPTEDGTPQVAVPAPNEKVPERTRRHARRPAPSLKGAEASVADSAVVTGRNLRHFWRQPDLLVFSTIQPIMFVVLFVYVFGGAVGRSLPPGVSYVDYLLPGIFVQSVTFRASNTAVGLSEDLSRGVIDRFRSMPMARSAVLVGRTTADLVRNVMIVGLMVVVGYLVGFRFQAGVVPALACVALVAAFGFALSWIFAFVALVVRGAETAQTAGFVVLFPLVFASSVFVPVSSLPDWLQPIAKASPVTLTADAARTLALTGGVPNSLAGALGVDRGTRGAVRAPVGLALPEDELDVGGEAGCGRRPGAASSARPTPCSAGSSTRPGLPPPRLARRLPPLDAFGALIFGVAGQQLSVRATRAIISRLETHFGGRLPSPAELLAADPQVPRAMGSPPARARRFGRWRSGSWTVVSATRPCLA